MLPEIILAITSLDFTPSIRMAAIEPVDFISSYSS